MIINVSHTDNQSRLWGGREKSVLVSSMTFLNDRPPGSEQWQWWCWCWWSCCYCFFYDDDDDDLKYIYLIWEDDFGGDGDLIQLIDDDGDDDDGDGGELMVIIVTWLMRTAPHLLHVDPSLELIGCIQTCYYCDDKDDQTVIWWQLWWWWWWCSVTPVCHQVSGDVVQLPLHALDNQR